jgi:hypothetical protein
VTTYRVKFEGPAGLALRVATALADADGVELTESDELVARDNSTVVLILTVEGPFDAVSDAVASIRGTIPSGATIDIRAG